VNISPVGVLNRAAGVPCCLLFSEGWSGGGMWLPGKPSAMPTTQISIDSIMEVS
jgi:hypothetical protein